MECYGGVDDGFFEREWERTTAVLAVHCRVEGVLCPCDIYVSEFTIDGLDATERIIELVRRASRDYMLRMVLLDTVIFAGFNIADIDEVYKATAIPVVAVFWYEPNRDAVVRALRLHFSDWRRRLQLLEKAWSTMREVACPKGRLLASWRGLGEWELVNTLCSLQLYTRQPEPLYTAHMVASRLSQLRARRDQRKRQG